MSDEPILHQYDVSPFAQRAKMALAIKGVARDAEPAASRGVAPGEPNGLMAGEHVVVRARDYGRDPIEGELLAADATSVTLLRNDPRAGRVAVHFPRLSFEISRS